MYAIIETCGKQYRLTPGDVVALEKLNGEVGQTITFDKVLLIGGKSDNNVLVGTPYVSQATLLGEILEQGKGEKLLTIKYKRRKGYRRMIGHRQQLTKVLVTKIEDGQGQSLQFDESKRASVLHRISIPAKKEKAKPAKQASAKTAAPSEAKEAPAKKRTPSAKSATKSSTAKKKA